MATDNVEKQRKRKEKKEKNKNKKEQEYEEPADPATEDKKTKKKNKKRKHQQPEDEGEGLDHVNKPRAKQNKRNKHSVVTDERFASVHFDPRFQRVPKKEAKVAIDSRFTRMLKDKSFDSSSAPVDKRGRPREEKEANRLLRYYQNEEEEREKEEEEEERDGGSETEASDDEGEGKESSSTDDDDEEFDFDDDEQNVIQSDVCQYLMPSHEDTPLTEQETYRLAVVNMDWDHIKAVDLYVAISSCLPKGGQVLSVGIYPSEFGLKCMEVEAVHGPSALIDNNEENSEDESESDDENLRNEKLRAYELNKLRYYYGVAVFDSSATANHVYKNLDGTELLRTSNVFDLRFIPDSMEFKHPPRDNTTVAPTRYSIPDFHTRALQQSKVNLTWEDDEPTRTKILRRKFNPDQLDELNEYLASSGDSDASDEDGESDGSEHEDAEPFPNGKAKKHKEVEKLRALLLSGDGSGSDKDEDDQDMEITFNTELEDLSKRIREKTDKKSETVWEQVLRKRSEKRKARKNRSKYSSDEDTSDSDVQEVPDQPDDFFMDEEEPPLDFDTNVSNKKKNKDSSKSKRGKGSQKEREESPDEDKEQEASKAELELLFAEDQGQSAKGYKLKRKKGKGKKGKEESIEAKLPDVDPSEDPRFSALFTSHLYALDPTDPQFKRSAAYARQKIGKQRKVKGTAQAEETEDAPEQTQMADDDVAPSKKEKYELSSTVQSLKRNLGNLKKGSKGR